MRRRDTLRKCAVLGTVGSLGLLAGCSGGGTSGPETEDSASLSVTDFDYEEGDSGNLVVTVTVENAGESEGTGTLYVTVTAAETTTGNETVGSNDEGDDDDEVAARESMDVSVPAGEAKTVRIPFEFTYQQFVRKGNISIDLRT